MPTFNDLVLTNTFGHHKVSRRWTWPSPNGQHINQIDYVLVRKCFRSEVNIARTWSFPEADTGSGHDVLMMTYQLHLKRIYKPKPTRLKFDLKKLRDPNGLETFQAIIVGEKFALLTIMNDEDADMDSMTNTFNTVLKLTQPVETERAREILGEHRQKKNLGHCWNSWPLRQKDRTEKEKIRTRRIDLRNTRKWLITSRGAWKRKKRKADKRTV